MIHGGENCGTFVVTKLGHGHTVGNFRIAGGHVIFVVGNGFQSLRSDYISLRKPSLRK
jgi:hypothetical protein